MSPHKFKYDFVISYAGEDQEYTTELNNALFNTGEVKVFFAPEFQSELWGKNLYEYLADLYSKKGRFCILLISRHYVEKRWTLHEWRSAQERALRDVDTDYILPIRLDDAVLPGLPSTIAYLDAHQYSVDEIAQMALSKLKSLESDARTLETNSKSSASSLTFRQELYYTEPATFESHIVSLLEENRLNPIKRYLVEAQSVFYSHISQLENCTDGEVQQARNQKLLPMLDNLATIGVVSIKYDNPDLFSSVITCLHDIFSTAKHFSFPQSTGADQLNATWVWLELITRVYALGAFLIKRKLFSWIPPLIRQDVSWDRSHRAFWTRYVLKQLAGEHSRGIPCTPTIEYIKNNEYWGVLFAHNEDEIIEAVCQLDFIQCIHVLDQGANPYPSFGAYFNHRTVPIVLDLVQHNKAREAIPDISDQALAEYIKNLDDLAAHIFFSSGTWDRGYWLSDMINQFLAQHLPSKPYNQ